MLPLFLSDELRPKQYKEYRSTEQITVINYHLHLFWLKINRIITSLSNFVDRWLTSPFIFFTFVLLTNVTLLKKLGLLLAHTGTVA